MNCFLSGAIVRTGGSQSCIGGAPSVKYSDSLETYDDVMAYINNLGLEEIDSTIYDYEMQGTAFEYINGQTDNENADLIISAIDNGGYYQTHGTQKIYLHLYVSLPFEINDNEDIYSAEGKYYATWLQIFEFEADGTLIKNERLADKGSICLNDGIYKFYAEPVVKIYMNY